MYFHWPSQTKENMYRSITIFNLYLQGSIYSFKQQAKK